MLSYMSGEKKLIEETKKFIEEPKDLEKIKKLKGVAQKLFELKAQKLEILRQISEYHRTHVLEFFTPSKQQEPFFEDLKDESKKIYVILGGNRSGKSEALVAAICCLIERRYPWKQKMEISLSEYKRYYDMLAKKEGTLLRFRKPMRIRVLGEDYEKSIGQVLLPKFFKFLRPELIAAKRKGQMGVINQIICTTGDIIDFLTYSQDPSNMEGWSGHVVAFDEPPPRPVFIANSRGLVDYAGITIMAMTPLKEPWIADELVNTGDQTISVYTFRSRDNPFIDQNSLDEFEKRLTDEEKETRLNGKFLHLQGLVFKEYDPKIHRIPVFDLPKNFTHYVAIDTHPRTEQALLFAAVSPRNEIYCTHEVFKHGTPEEVVEWITDYHLHYHQIEKAVIDPSSQGDTNRGDSTFQIIERGLAKYNIPLEFGSKDLSGGILQVKQMLKTPNGTSALFIFDSLARTHYEFLHYVWDDWRSGDKTRGAKQRPRDADDHMMENLRRLIQLPVVYRDVLERESLIEQANKGAVLTDKYAGY